MRKIISLGLVFAMCLGLAGCGNGSKYNLKDAKTCNIEGISFKYPKEWEASGEEGILGKEDNGKQVSFYYYCSEYLSAPAMDVDIWYNKTKDSILENHKTSDFFKIETQNNITVAGQDCYHIKLTDKYDDITDNHDNITEEYIFDSSKGVVVFCALFVENNIYNETLEDFENISKVLPDILKTVTIE